MAAGGVLNADMPQLGAWLRRGARWWTGELRGLLPAGLRRGGETLLLHAPTGDGEWRLTRRARPLPIDDQAARRGTVTLVAPPSAVLLRRTPMPALPPEDLRRMLALDLDRLAPLPAGEAVFDWVPLSRDPARERMDVLLGVMRRTEAERLRDRARELGLRPARLAAIDGDGALRFDFLRDLPGAAPGRRDRLRWWAAVAALFALNLALLIGRDALGTRRLEAAVDAAAPSAVAARALQGRIGHERRTYAAALAARNRHEPLRVVAAVGVVLPSGAWVQRFGWDGRTVRIAGFKDRSLDVLAALRRSPILRDVHASGGDAASQAAAAQPYDVSALVAPPR